ncbi:hypothetical protein D1872_263290 [compost metagenome]
MFAADHARSQMLNRNGVLGQMAAFYGACLQLVTRHSPVAELGRRHGEIAQFRIVDRSVLQMDGFDGTAADFFGGHRLVLKQIGRDDPFA